LPRFVLFVHFRRRNPIGHVVDGRERFGLLVVAFEDAFGPRDGLGLVVVLVADLSVFRRRSSGPDDILQ